jgi:SAM-dependent methyltransferase
MSDADRERWDLRWAAGAERDGAAPPEWLRELGDDWPARGRALDVAAGAGRVAVWLAREGLSVTAVDVSPVGLARARSAAAAGGLAVETLVLDLERDPLPPGPFDLVTCFGYLQRDLFPALAERLAPRGILACEIATVRNLERHARPGRRFLLEPGEIVDLVGPLELLLYREGWFGDRALARIAARRRMPPG